MVMQAKSELPNNAVKQAITEDSEDFAAFEERVVEPLIKWSID